MSESDLSDVPSATAPSDTELEKSLREEVRKAAAADIEYTVRTIRKASEATLDLPEDFYKTHDEWNERSKVVIRDEADKIANADEKSEEEEQPAKAKARAKPQPKKQTVPKQSTKRRSTEDSVQPRKKKKHDSDRESSATLSSPPTDTDEAPEKVKSPKKTAKSGVKASGPPSKSKTKINPDSKSPNKPSAKDEPEPQEMSESEMSDVVDDEPVKKRRSKSKDTADQKPKKPTSKSAQPEEIDPDKEEIKKLQGWLVKCGVRKVWGKELKPYETSKAKIKHLKGMLTDIGMTGRFSNEKAAGIKEARELAADIEAVQEGAQRWGTEGDEDGGKDGGDTTRSGRRLVRGAKNYDFLSSDGEETD